MNTWIENLKAGDIVLVSANHARDTIMRVKNVTKSQIIVFDGKNEKIEHRFQKKTGRSIGTTTWNHRYLAEATTERLESVLLRQMQIRAKTLLGEIVIPDDYGEVKSIIEFAEKYQPKEVPNVL